VLPPQHGITPLHFSGLTLAVLPLQHGITPLHFAAHFEHTKVAKLLLDAGANVEAVSKVSGLWAVRAVGSKGSGQ
jgi:ankyrin repeat protein